MKWHKFDKSKGYRQLRPPIGKWVMVKLEAKPHDVATLPCGLAIGYRKDAAGDKTCPYFVIPGIGGEVLEWCDCLPEGFEYPKASNGELCEGGPQSVKSSGSRTRPSQQ